MTDFLASTEMRLNWSVLLFIWMIVNYLPPLFHEWALSEKTHGSIYVSAAIRMLTLLLAGLILLGLDPRPLAIAFTLGLGAFLLHVGRHQILERQPAFAAEWEIGFNGGMALLLACMLSQSSSLNLPEFLQHPSMIRLLTAGSGLLFLGRGCAVVVGGILQKTRTGPKTQKAETDAQVLYTGRIIGILERLLAFMMILLAAYSALGFLIAAKGLVRAKEFEDKAFAEYFLIGTLTSILTALLVALSVQFICKI